MIEGAPEASKASEVYKTVTRIAREGESHLKRRQWKRLESLERRTSVLIISLGALTFRSNGV